MKTQKFTRSTGTRQLIRKIAEAGTLAIALASGMAQAALHDRGGGLVYDDVLDVTWLADANYAKTSGYDSDGWMNWLDALEWASNLEYYDSVRGVVYTDWRLPAIRPINGVEFSYTSSSNAGVVDIGYNVSAPGTYYERSGASELAYMYYVNFGFSGYYNQDGSYNPFYGIYGDGRTGGQSNLKFVRNLQSRPYWTGLEFAAGTDSAWLFNFGLGDQNANSKTWEFAAWAVRTGDVAVVPEPAPAILFGMGFSLIFALVKKGAVT